MTTAEPDTAQCFPALPTLPAGTPLSGTQAWLTKNPHPGLAASGTEGYRRLLPGNLLSAQGNPESLGDSGRRSRYRSLYGYAWNNPLANIDPSGLACVYNGGPNGDTSDSKNYSDDDSGGQNCADAFASAPQQVTVNDNYSLLDLLRFSSWWGGGGFGISQGSASQSTWECPRSYRVS